VPGTLEKCREIGLDLETWLGEGLLDYIAPAPFWDTVTDLPFDAFVSLASDTHCRVYACTSEQVGPGPHVPPPAAALRAGAFNAWRQGVDGVYLYNFHHQTVYNIDDEDLLHQLGHPATLEFEDKLYTVTGCHEVVKYPPLQGVFFESFEHQLPMALPEQPRGPGNAVRFLVADDLAKAARRGLLDSVTLELIIVELTSEDLVEFSLNGRPLPEAPYLGLYPHYPAKPGRNAMYGNYALRYDLRDGDWITPGWNELHVVLRQRNLGLSCDLVLHDLNLEIRYRILPRRP
jgi:hypothetical protein